MSDQPGSAAQRCRAPHPILAEPWPWPRMCCDLDSGHEGRHERFVSESATVIWGGDDA